MIPDLTQVRMLTVEEVARLFRCKPNTVRKKVQAGLFPVPPRGSGKPMLFSSVDLLRYFEDPKAAKQYAPKRGVRGGA